MWRIRVTILSLLYVVLLAASHARACSGTIRLVRMPGGGQVPEAIYAGGLLHVTYGKDGNAYYVRSSDDGRTFSAPLRLNRREGTVTVGGERGPKIALGGNGTLHVVWLGHYQKGGGVWYTRSTDGGRTFEPERDLLDTKIGTDGATVAANSEGRVFVFWLDGRLGPDEKDNPVAGPIFMARSTDSGVTWSANERVKYDFPGRACACCRLEARVGPDGFLYVAFRTGYRNIRDFYLLRGAKSANEFHAVRVSVDNWEMEGCPMMGAPFTVDSRGRVLIAWMSRDRAYLSRSGERGSPFSPRTGAPESDGPQRYPIALSDPSGAVTLLWRQGSQVEWARFGAEGRSPRSRGTAAESADPGKFAAFLDRRGDVCVVL